MAGRLYTSSTLNANWFEERAPPLKGVLADYGFRETATSSKSEMRPPSKHREFQAPKSGSRYGMVCRDTLAEVAESWADGAEEGSGFGAVLPTHGADHDARYMETSASAAFGDTKKKTRFERMAEESKRPAAPKSGGAGGGIKGSGATGEVFKDEDDPQRNTAAQRSWLYSEDPMIKTHKAPPTEVRSKGYMSLTMPEGPAVPEGPKGRAANMTLSDAEQSRRPGVNIWADEISQ